MIYYSNSVEDTKNIATEFGGNLKPFDIVAFTGDLGAGKTAFCSSVINALGIKDRVCSPTYNIVNEYPGICHFDMYRINSADELYDIGFDDYLKSGDILLIEWSENIKDGLPREYISIDIKMGEHDNARIITIDNISN